MNLTAGRAAALISLLTLGIALAGAVVMWLIDDAAFPTFNSGLWFAIQTVTTVGFGDHVPTSTAGRWMATIVMVTGVGFMSVITATITAVFVESARRRRRAPDAITLERIAERLDRIERLMDERLEADQRRPDGGDGEGLEHGPGV